MTRNSAHNMMVYDILETYLKVFRQFVLLRQYCQVAFFIGRKNPFVNGVETADTIHDIPDKILMVHQVMASQVIDTIFVMVYDVMDLLCEFVIIGNIYDEVWKYFNRFIVPYKLFHFLDPWRSVSKYHGDP